MAILPNNRCYMFKTNQEHVKYEWLAASRELK
jgi:hypothetical protein